MTLTAVLAVAVGTYLFRVVGPLFARRVQISQRLQEVLVLAAVALLAGLTATQSLTEGEGFAGWARPAGMVVAAIVAWRRAPLIVVVLVAALVTASLRAFGVP